MPPGYASSSPRPRLVRPVTFPSTLTPGVPHTLRDRGASRTWCNCLFKHWTSYANVDIMLGAGLALYPEIPPSYAQGLAIQLKHRTPSSVDAAVDPDAPTNTADPDVEQRRDLLPIHHPYCGALPSVPYTVWIDDTYLKRLDEFISILCREAMVRSMK